MLVIYLHHSQVGLLEVLREVCPDLSLAPRSLYPGYVTYRAALAEGKAGLGQTACLRRLHILYLDTEAQRKHAGREQAGRTRTSSVPTMDGGFLRGNVFRVKAMRILPAVGDAGRGRGVSA